MFLMCNGFSQMSFNTNIFKKSAFTLTEKKTLLSEENSYHGILFNSENETRRRKDYSEFNNSLKINILSMLVAKFGLQYERKICDKMSVALTLGFLYQSDDEGSKSGFSINPEFRYYFEEAIKGWYVSPYITYFVVKETRTDTYFNNNFPIDTYSKITQYVYGGGFVGGHQWILNGFTLDVFCGISITASSRDKVHTLGYPIYGILPTIGGCFGYSF